MYGSGTDLSDDGPHDLGLVRLDSLSLRGLDGLGDLGEDSSRVKAVSDASLRRSHDVGDLEEGRGRREPKEEKELVHLRPQFRAWLPLRFQSHSSISTDKS